MHQIKNPAFFVVGCPRSGTRLLGRLLDAHPSLCIGPDCHRLIETLSRGGPLDQPLYESWDRDSYSVTVADIKKRGLNLCIQELTRCFLEQFAAQQGKSLVGHKLATRVCEPLLYNTWSDIRFIHEYRDGRDVFCSVREWQWVEEELTKRLPSYLTDPEATVAGWWIWNVVRRQKFAARHGVHWLEISYESLIADPQQVLVKVCDFLQVEYNKQMLHFYKKSAISDALDVGEDWKRPITAKLRSWEKELTSEEIARFQAEAGKTLIQLGYSLAPVSISAAAEERAKAVSQATIITLEKNAINHGWGSVLDNDEVLRLQ